MQNPLHSDVFDLVTLTIANATHPTYPILTCPANARIQLISATFAHTTTAVPHYVFIKAEDPSNYTFGLTISTVDQGVVDTWNYHFVSGVPNIIDLSAQNLVIVPLSSSLIINPGEEIQINSLGFVATETFTNIRLRCKQWILP